MSCGAPEQGAALAGVDLGKQAVVEGVVRRDGAPVSPAYVRLLDRSGEFTAEVVTSEAGEFRFFAGPGEWTVRTLAPRSDAVDVPVTAELGRVTEVEILV